MRTLRTDRAGRPGRLVAALTVAAALTTLVSGCGSSDGGPSAPDGMTVTTGAPKVQISRTVSVEATYTYSKRESGFDWYVDDILGGNSMLGTITQSNPATYTAPPAVPGAEEVVITAVSQTDTTLSAVDTLAVVFTIKHVDADSGNDTSGGGAWNNPFETIAYALGQISAGDTILVHAGTYDDEDLSGARITIPEDVTLRGVSADSCFLEMSGSIWPSSGSVFESFTMEIAAGESPLHAVHTTADCTIRDIHTSQVYGNSAIRAHGGSQLIEDCGIVNTSGVLQSRGMELVFGTHATVRNCTVSGWSYGIFANEDSDPLIEQCWIHGNGTGVMIYGGTPDSTNPDLGGGARDGVGLNTIEDNTGAGVKNQTPLTIWALYNTWDHDPPVEGPPYPCDLENNDGGSILTQP